jgi:aminoacyl-tRNA hydrolase
MGGRFKAHRGGAEVLEGRLAGRRVVLALPRSYVNLSGRPVASTARFFKVPPADIVIVHDELDLDFGVLKLKRGGGEGGHNGLRSISTSLGTRDYLRVRVGIGRPPGRMDPADHVLRDFSATERRRIASTESDPPGTTHNMTLRRAGSESGPPQLVVARFSRGRSLQRAQGLGLRALLALSHLELHALVLIQSPVAAGVGDRGEVDEDVSSTPVGRDETVALLCVEPLHSSLRHAVSLLVIRCHRDSADAAPGRFVQVMPRLMFLGQNNSTPPINHRSRA